MRMRTYAARPQSDVVMLPLSGGEAAERQTVVSIDARAFGSTAA